MCAAKVINITRERTVEVQVDKVAELEGKHFIRVAIKTEITLILIDRYPGTSHIESHLDSRVSVSRTGEVKITVFMVDDEMVKPEEVHVIEERGN